MQQKPLISVLSQRLLILTGAILEYMITCIQSDNRTEDDVNKTQQQSRFVQPKQPQQFVSRPTLKPDAFVTTRQSIVVTKEDTVVSRSGISKSRNDYSNMTDKEELYARLANDNNIHQSTYNKTPYIEPGKSNDISKLHAQLKPTDVELLYSRLPTDATSTMDRQEGLTEDQQMLHARLIGAELERQGYVEEDQYE